MISQERPGEGSQFTHWFGQQFTALLDSPGHTDRRESAWNKLPEVWEAAGHQPCLCRRLHPCPGHLVSQWDVIPCPQSLCSSPGAPLGTGRGSQVSLLQVNTPAHCPWPCCTPWPWLHGPSSPSCPDPLGFPIPGSAPAGKGWISPLWCLQDSGRQQNVKCWSWEVENALKSSQKSLFYNQEGGKGFN